MNSGFTKMFSGPRSIFKQIGQSIRNIVTLTLSCFILVSLAGCIPSDGPLPASNAPGLVLDKGYKLGTGDTVNVTVFNEPTVSRDGLLVDGVGEITLPLIGAVSVNGKTIREVEVEVRDLLVPDFFADPRVTIQMASYRPFYILGQVTNAGEYPFALGLTVNQAVAKAGGFAELANTRRAFIKRVGENAEREVRIDADTPVMPGDTIRIPEGF